MAFHTVTLKETCDIADGTRMFFFTKPEGFHYEPGQYVAMRITDLIVPDQRNGVRSLSIATAPCEESLGFGLRQSESGFKQTLWNMTPGATLEVTDAVGFFTVASSEQREIIFLIGGIGITPVRSILKQAEHDKSEKKYTLFFANRFHKDAPYREEIANLSLPGLTVVDVLEKAEEEERQYEHEERGFIRAELLEKYVEAPKECVYYIVGSPGFTAAMEKMLLDFGVTQESWHTDPFTGLVSEK
jgi:ferredoxin-NADP reductase